MIDNLFFFSFAIVSKSLLIVLGTLPPHSPQNGNSSQMRPLLVKPAQNLAGSAYVLRTCRPSGDKRSHWLLKTRLRGEKMLGLAFETACHMAQPAHGSSGGARLRLRSVRTSPLRRESVSDKMRGCIQRMKG